MSVTTRTAGEVRVFDYARWRAQLPALAEQYRAAKPFPHIHLEDFLEPEVARICAREFPAANSDTWTLYKHYNENKAGLTKRELFPAMLRRLTDELNSPEFVAWISGLTGFSGLVSDQDLIGGGLQQSGAGGFLNVHADFTMHHHRPNWRRRVNIILYLNPDWQADWGGALELWDDQMRSCVVSVPPLLNHVLIFNSTETSYHGFPRKITCPANVSRNTLALFYYSVEQISNHAPAFANFKSLPQDSAGKRALARLDTFAVQTYSKLKRAFGINDEVASKILGFFSRTK